METYDCEICGDSIEIETWEAMFGHHEHYEQGQCKQCFDGSIDKD